MKITFFLDISKINLENCIARKSNSETFHNGKLNFSERISIFHIKKHLPLKVSLLHEVKLHFRPKQQKNHLSS